MSGAVVVEDLGARAAGAGVAHRPEFDFSSMRVKRFGSIADLLEPEVRRLVVVLVDGDPELLRRDLQRAGDELPGELDRLGLEVVAEAEVAEHLEERVVARGVADVLEVVVLAARAHAPLRARRALVAALVLAEEDVLELHHAGVGEEQRRVVAGHERRRRHDRVAARAEELQERGPELAAIDIVAFFFAAISPRRKLLPTAARTWSALKPRWLRNRACRPRWTQVVGSLAPKRLRRTSAQRSRQSAESASTAAAIWSWDSPASRSLYAIPTGPRPRFA